TADVAVVTSDNPRHEAPQAIIDEILAGCREVEVSLHVESDRRAAIEWAFENAEPMDSVLIAGKGHENVQIIGEERRAFDDVQVSGEILQHMAIRQLAQTG